MPMNDLCIIMLMELFWAWGRASIQSVRAMRDVVGFICGFLLKVTKHDVIFWDAGCFMVE